MVDSPPTWLLAVATQLYVDETLEVRDKFTILPEHTSTVLTLVMLGAGFTVTVKVWAVPMQLPMLDVGVMV